MKSFLQMYRRIQYFKKISNELNIFNNDIEKGQQAEIIRKIIEDNNKNLVIFEKKF